MIECASARTTITYSELAAKIGRHYRAMSPALEDLLQVCHRLGLPTIGTLVVSKTTGLPGDGFMIDGEAKKIAYVGSKYAQIVEEEQKRIYNHRDWQPLRDAYTTRS